MPPKQGVEFWATVVPIAFAAQLSLAIYILKFALPFKNAPGRVWWPVYIFVCLLFSGLFGAVGAGISFLAGLPSDPLWVEIARYSILGYLVHVGYVPASIAINKLLKYRYPLPWEKF